MDDEGGERERKGRKRVREGVVVVEGDERKSGAIVVFNTHPSGANIFLSSNGSIKLGDFGLSVQLKNLHKTMPNEIRQQVGTIRKYTISSFIPRPCIAIRFFLPNVVLYGILASYPGHVAWVRG